MNEKIKILIEGMHCQSCAGLIESNIKKMDGVIKCDVNLPQGYAFIEYNSEKVKIKKIEEIIEKLGYKVVKNQEEKDVGLKVLKKKFIISLIFSIPLIYISMGSHLGMPVPEIFIKYNSFFQFILTIPILLQGIEIFKNGFNSFIKTKRGTMDTLISLGVLSGFLYSTFIFILSWAGYKNLSKEGIYFEVSALLITIILLGRYLEGIAKGKTSQAIKKLIELKPKMATVLKGDKELEVPIEEIKVSDILIIKPGEKIPVDGEVIEGHSVVDESMITGEYLPVEKIKGCKVIGGTLSKNGILKIIAKKTGKETFLAQIIKIVEEAQTSKAPIQKMADLISSYFVPAVLIISIITFFIWYFSGQSFGFSLKVSISVLIISCPCALGLATPAAVIVGMGIGAKKGILFKNAEALQRAEKIDTFLFDKTGTLTKGEVLVEEIIGEENFNIEDILKFASALSKNSTHPLSEAILKKAQELKIEIPETDTFEEIIGKGLLGNYKGKKIALGNLKFFKELKISTENFLEKINKIEEEGKTVVIISIDEKICGIISLSDILKNEAIELIKNLKEREREVFLVTGDREKIAKKVGKILGIEKIFWGILPQDKKSIVEKLRKEGKKVAFVGDGINDAPALSEANLGIALGKGKDIACEAGDLVLIRDNLMDILKAIDLSHFTMKKIKQNLFWAFFYNVLCIPVAGGALFPFYGVLLSPLIAGFAMSFSSLSVVLNSLTLKKIVV